MQTRTLIVAAVALLWPLLGFAQTPPATEAPAATQPTEAPPATDQDEVTSSDDLQALVAPVALYPDPMLAMILQAAVFPLQIVQADRFLTKRQSDPTLAPPDDFDPSVVGLLNYPS